MIPTYEPPIRESTGESVREPGFAPPAYGGGYNSARSYEMSSRQQHNRTKGQPVVVAIYPDQAEPEPMEDDYPPPPHPFFTYSTEFERLAIRVAFIRRVFTLVAAMLCLTAVITALPFLFDSVKTFVVRNYWLIYIALVVNIVVYLTLVCCSSVRRTFPTNAILLVIFTVAEGFLTMCLSMFYTTSSVLLALLMTFVACTIIIAFASQTKLDLTRCLGVMCILSLCFIFFGIIALLAAIVFHVPWLHTLYAVCGALLMMAWLAIDIQASNEAATRPTRVAAILIMGGRRVEIAPDEHIYAALQLFVDIVQIFQFLLQIFGERQ